MRKHRGLSFGVAIPGELVYTIVVMLCTLEVDV